MRLLLLNYIKNRIARFVAHRVREELVGITECQRNTASLNSVDDVTSDSLIFNQNESARALAIGVATAYVADIEGDIAEFGTMTGFTATALARAIKQAEASLADTMSIYKTNPKSLHLFDSFEGLPEIVEEVDASSPHVLDGAWSAGACKCLSKDELKSLVSTEFSADRTFIFPGWFNETVQNIPDTTRYALVHIDGDLYSSTIDVLQGLFSRKLISPGCLVFFDDWNCNRASQQYGERKAWTEIVDQFNVRYSDRGGYGLFGHSFFIHEYD